MARYRVDILEIQPAKTGFVGFECFNKISIVQLAFTVLEYCNYFCTSDSVYMFYVAALITVLVVLTVLEHHVYIYILV